jgi:predicted DNA-binding protein
VKNPEELADYDRRAKNGSGRRKPLVNACLPPEMIERMKAVAKAEDRPISAIVRRAVDQYLARASEAA